MEHSTDNDNAVAQPQHEGDERQRRHHARQNGSTVASNILSRLSRALVSWTHIDHGGIPWVPPIRNATVCAVNLILTRNDASLLFHMAIFGAFVGLADRSGSLALRVRSLGLSLLAVVSGALFGGIVSRHWVRALVAFAMAIPAGYAGCFGPLCGLAGVLGLMTYAVFAGVPTTLLDACVGCGWVAAGGCVQIFFAVLPEMCGALDAVRTDIFLAWRGLGWAMSHPLHGPLGADATFHVAAARRVVAASGECGEALRWLEWIVETADRVRAGSIILAVEHPLLTREERESVDAFLRAAGCVAKSIGTVIHLWFPKYFKLLGLRSGLESMDAAADVAESKLPIQWATVVDLVRTELHDAADAVAGPWPRGRRDLRRLRDVFPSTFNWPHAHARRVMMRHAFRLALTLSLATIPTIFDLSPLVHANWLPMTVVFIVKPGFGGTLRQTLARVAGTFLVLVFASTLLFAFSSAGVVVEASLTVVLVFVGVSIATAFFFANYAMFTLGVTSLILSSFVWVGDPIGVTSAYRMVWTFVAGVLVVAMMLLFRPWMPDVLGEKLKEQTLSLRAYTDAVVAAADDDEDVDGTGEEADKQIPADGMPNVYVDDARDALVRARLATLAAIEIAETEPGRHRIGPALARKIQTDLLVAGGIALAVDVAGRRPHHLLPELSSSALADTDRLAARLGGTESSVNSGATASTTESAAHPTGCFAEAIARCHRRLDAARL